MLRADNELLARVARLNQALVASALPLANHTLTPDQLRALGDELRAIGQEFLDRADPTWIDVPVDVVEDIEVLAIENPHRTVS